MLVWLTFLLGQFLHVAVQIDAIVKAQNNTAMSWKAVFADRWIRITARTFGASMLFGIILGGGLPELLKVLGVDPSPQWIITMSTMLGSTGILGICLSGFIGLGVDSLLAFIPGLKTYLPPPIDENDAVATKAFVAGAEATKEAVTEAVAVAAETVKETGPQP